ncbi:hypothetical protein D3C84_1279980 [compost metagenome]
MLLLNRVPLVSTNLPSPLSELLLVVRTPIVSSVGSLLSKEVIEEGRSSASSENVIDSPSVR